MSPAADPEGVRQQIEGRVVLVTGAGGSVGAELCRQIADHWPSRLVLLDHSDDRLDATWRSLGRSPQAGWDDVVLADVRDLPTLTATMLDVRPDLVFHTAALNDEALLQRHPREAWLTNVGGTRNMLRAATDAGVGTFVRVSPRAATHPDSVLGRTELLADRLTVTWAREHLGRFLAVRVGEDSAHESAPGIPLELACRLILEATATGADGRVVDATTAHLEVG